MADIFVRRSTGILLFLIATLAIVCVALVVIVARDRHQVVLQPESQRSSREGKMLKPDHHHDQKKPPDGDHDPDNMDDKEPTTTPAPKEWETNIRIPLTTIPLHYDLYLHPNLTNDRFTGKVSIMVNVTSPMEYLVTHVKFMNVTMTKLYDREGDEVDLHRYFEYKPNEFWVVIPSENLEPDVYTLYYEFNGDLTGHIVGLYKSVYTTRSGEQRAMATSKFQPTDARRAFPCFDEPSFKSTYNTTLVKPSTDNYIALTNMPAIDERPGFPHTGATEVIFQKSVPMVTYLACFIICDFDYVPGFFGQNNDQEFRTYAPKDEVANAHYANNIGIGILKYFENYFEVKFPLPKLDQIAIPDFASGAMEHWGLITYRSNYLLYQEYVSSVFNKQRIATIVSHELAHMWFGNLATLQWWNDLWLNEGFASYMEYKGVTAVETEWDMEAQFVIADVQPVLKLDEILSSHPIVQEVNHPDEITEIFDKISYSKGASVLRMLESFLGNEQFRIGIRNFLRRFEYKNAVTQDLWDDLQLVVNDGASDSSEPVLNVTRIMDTWTKQMGFPVINVEVDNSTDNLILTQERFLVDPDAVSANDSPYGYKWDIPISYKTNNIPAKSLWMNMDDKNVMIPRSANTEWIKLNNDQFGYYRVNYDGSIWQQLIDLLNNNHEALTAVDRANLIDDIMALAAADKQSYATAFSLIQYLTKETHYVPWTSAATRLYDMQELLQRSPTYDKLKQNVLKLVTPMYNSVGFDDVGSHMTKLIRTRILLLACSFGHPDCLKKANSEFAKTIKNDNYKPKANLRSLVYRYGMKEAGMAEYATLMDKYTSELNAQEKKKLMRGLASTNNPMFAKMFLELAKNESIVRSQDLFTLFYYMASNPSTLSTVWDFFRQNYGWLVERYTLNNRRLGRTIRSMAFLFTTDKQFQELKDFLAKYPEAGAGKRARKQALEKVEQNLKWIKSNAKEIDDWLTANQ